MDSIGHRGSPASRAVDQFQAYHQELEQGRGEEESRGEEEARGGGHHSSTGISDLIINISSSSSSSSGIQPGQAGPAASAFMFPAAALQQQPSAPSLLPWPLHAAVPDKERFFFPSASLPPLPPPPPPPPLPTPVFYSYGAHDLLYARRASAAALQFAYDGGGNSGSTSADPMGLAGLYVAPDAFLRTRGLMSAAATSPFGALHAELGNMTPQEIMDAKALAASKSHSEAERRRRERINAHLARLRSLLPSTTKTDKASLLAEVIQHVKELKRQTSEIADEAESPLPTETDELTVDAASDEEGRFVVRASLCCDDRSDLLPDLIKALKALKLRTRKAEITTLGGRIKHVLLITADDDADAEADDDDENRHQRHSVATIQDALKAVMERAPQSDASVDPPSTTSAGAGIKRQRTANLSGILEHRSI